MGVSNHRMDLAGTEPSFHSRYFEFIITIFLHSGQLIALKIIPYTRGHSSVT